MKKIIIILLLVLPFYTLQSESFDAFINSIKNSLKTLWHNEKPIKPSHSISQQNIKLKDFSVTDMNGDIHSRKSVKGKYLVINFWATWCPPCLKEIPAFVDFYELYKDKVQLLGLNYEEADVDKITEFSDTFLINYPIILFTEKNATEFGKFGKITVMPTTYIYSPDGDLIDFYKGEIGIEILKKAIL